VLPSQRDSASERRLYRVADGEHLDGRLGDVEREPRSATISSGFLPSRAPRSCCARRRARRERR
jgi:hypothetical protein